MWNLFVILHRQVTLDCQMYMSPLTSCQAYSPLCQNHWPSGVGGSQCSLSGVSSLRLEHVASIGLPWVSLKLALDALAEQVPQVLPHVELLSIRREVPQALETWLFSCCLSFVPAMPGPALGPIAQLPFGWCQTLAKKALLKTAHFVQVWVQWHTLCLPCSACKNIYGIVVYTLVLLSLQQIINHGCHMFFEAKGG